MNLKVLNFIENLLYSVPKYVKTIEILNEEIVLVVSLSYFKKLLHFLKKNVNFQVVQLIDITAVDLLVSTERFILIYQLLSLRFNCRITIKVFFRKKLKFFIF